MVRLGVQEQDIFCKKFRCKITTVYENKSTSSDSAVLSLMYFKMSSVPMSAELSSSPNRSTSFESGFLTGVGFAAICGLGLAPGRAGLEAGSAGFHPGTAGLDFGTAGFVGRLGLDKGRLA